MLVCLPDHATPVESSALGCLGSYALSPSISFPARDLTSRNWANWDSRLGSRARTRLL